MGSRRPLGAHLAYTQDGRSQAECCYSMNKRWVFRATDQGAKTERPTAVLCGPEIVAGRQDPMSVRSHRLANAMRHPVFALGVNCRVRFPSFSLTRVWAHEITGSVSARLSPRAL